LAMQASIAKNNLASSPAAARYFPKPNSVSAALPGRDRRTYVSSLSVLNLPCSNSLLARLGTRQTDLSVLVESGL